MDQNRRRFAARQSLFAAILALACVAPFAHAAGPKPSTDHDQFVVKFRDGSVEHANASQRQQRLDAVGRAHGLRLGQLRRLAVGADVIRSDRVLDAIGTKALLARLRADPRVEYAFVDRRMTVQAVPNDPAYAGQWHYADPVGGINAPTAWDIGIGSGQVVAVLDTGITAHPDLDANVVAGYDFVSSTTDANDGGGRDADASDPGDWCDGELTYSTWHGTHVAGTIAAVTNNALGVAGVAYGARVQPVRVIGQCYGSESDVADAIVWASGGAVSGVPANATPAKVINISFSTFGSCYTFLQDAIDAAVANGAVVVAAAGNYNWDSIDSTPGNCANVVSVAATGPGGGRAGYSDYGDLVDIAAPGGEGGTKVQSTSNDGDYGPRNPVYGGSTGTSMAAAHVSGVAALVRAASGNALTPAEIALLLQSTARAFPVACTGCGAGIVDAAAAVVASAVPVLWINEQVTAAEGNSGTQVFTFTVTLSEALATPTSFDIATANGTATAGTDYVAKSTLGAVIPAGSTTYSFAVTVNGDTRYEGNESFLVQLDNVASTALVVDDTGIGNVRNDDVMELVNGVPVTGLSDGTMDHNTYSAMQVPVGATNLHFATSGGSGDAELYVRFNALPTAFSFDCASFNVGNGESCDVGAQAGTWYVMVNAFDPYSGLSLVGSYTPPPNDTDISVGNATITEGNSGTKLMTFTVSLSNASVRTVTFDIATANGAAIAGSDYVAKSATALNIPIGQLSRTFNVTINGDSVVEPDEALLVNLANVISADVVDAQGQGTITNDDGPTLSIADAGYLEGNASTRILTFTVTLSQASIYPVTFNIGTVNGTAAAGSDYTAKSLAGQAIAAGQLTKSFSILTNGDTAVEGNETLFVQLGNASVPVADGQARGMLVNDDGPTLSIADVAVAEGNSGTKLMVFTVSLSQVASAKVTFNFATAAATASAGSDFDPLSVAGLAIPQGQLSKTVSVVIRGDTTVEADETLRGNISMGNVSVLDGVGIGTITNDD